MRITKTRDEMQDEIIRRMAKPDDIRALRNQKERIEAENQKAFQDRKNQREAELLRREIRDLGHEPVR